MMGAKTIGCINHPNVEAIGRCRQCSKPVCGECGVRGPQGLYCSEPCREKHEQFMKRAEELGLERVGRRGIAYHIRNLLGTLFMLAVVLFGIGFLATRFYIPVVSEVTETVRAFIGL